jgi:hypothetical protein
MKTIPQKQPLVEKIAKSGAITTVSSKLFCIFASRSL